MTFEKQTKTTRRRVPSKYRGVRFCKDNQKWRAKIKIAGENFVLGYFDSEYEAAQVYASVKHGGEPRMKHE